MAAEDDAFLYYEAVTRQVQERQTIRTFLELTQAAFDACAHTFTTSALNEKEKKCVGTMTKKFIGASLRVSMRFGEAQAEASKTTATLSDEALRPPPPPAPATVGALLGVQPPSPATTTTATTAAAATPPSTAAAGEAATRAPVLNGAGDGAGGTTPYDPLASRPSFPVPGGMGGGGTSSSKLA